MIRLMDRPSIQAIEEAREALLCHRRRMHTLRICLLVLLLFSLVVTGCLFTVAAPLHITQEDMSPTLLPGDWALCNTLAQAPQRGEVAAFTLAEELVLRRVIALEGDQVRIDRDTGHVYINGQLLEEAYVTRSIVGNMDIPDTVTVPAGCVFVLGDQRLIARDSRQEAFGMLSLESCKGVVWGRLWPLYRIGIL